MSKIAVFLLQFLHLDLHGRLLALSGSDMLIFAVVGAAQGEPQRHSVHAELLGQIPQQKALIVAFE